MNASAFSWPENHNYTGKYPDFERQEYETLADMKAVSDETMPLNYIASCNETGKFYTYCKNNTIDEITGKFREFNNTQAYNISSDIPNNTVVQYIGEDTDDYKFGHFYKVLSSKAKYSLTSSVVISALKNSDVELCKTALGIGKHTFVYEASGWKLGETTGLQLADLKATYGIQYSSKAVIEEGTEIVIENYEETLNVTELSIGSGSGITDDDFATESEINALFE